jgi:Gluconate 2-dehydrogenase subunit 3
MLKLKLPRVPTAPAGPLPPEVAALADGAPAATMAVLLGRREFLKALAIVLAALALPVTHARRGWAAARGRFLTRPELATLEALVDRIIPPDDDPGAKALGAATYIDRLLSAIDPRALRRPRGRAPHLFAGGPFSRRNPYPDSRNGRPSHRRPRNSFRRFIEPTRLQRLRWSAELYGSQAVPGADVNDAVLGGPLIGLRDLYRSGLAKVDMVAKALKGAALSDLPIADQDAVVAVLDMGMFAPDPRRGDTFMDIVIRHTIEGCFAAPEYGGNVRGRGWKMIGLQGDVQPLGYSIFSKRADDYRERPDLPMTTADPADVPVPRPLSAEGAQVQALIAVASNALGAC